MFYSESFVKHPGLPPSHVLNIPDDCQSFGGVAERLLDSMVRLRVPSSTITSCGITIDRKILAEIAYDSPEAFKTIVQKAQSALN